MNIIVTEDEVVELHRLAQPLTDHPVAGKLACRVCDLIVLRGHATWECPECHQQRLHPPECLRAEIATLRAEVVALAEGLREAIGIVEWMSGSSSFGPKGEAAEGWLKALPKLEILRALARGGKGE